MFLLLNQSINEWIIGQFWSILTHNYAFYRIILHQINFVCLTSILAKSNIFIQFIFHPPAQIYKIKDFYYFIMKRSMFGRLFGGTTGKYSKPLNKWRIHTNAPLCACVLWIYEMIKKWQFFVVSSFWLESELL